MRVDQDGLKFRISGNSDFPGDVNPAEIVLDRFEAKRLLDELGALVNSEIATLDYQPLIGFASIDVEGVFYSVAHVPRGSDTPDVFSNRWFYSKVELREGGTRSCGAYLETPAEETDPRCALAALLDFAAADLDDAGLDAGMLAIVARELEDLAGEVGGDD